MEKLTLSKEQQEQKAAELGLIQNQAQIEYGQTGYWLSLAKTPCMDAEWKLARIITVQKDERIEKKLRAWGKKWGIGG
jgi:hypothetical protein